MKIGDIVDMSDNKKQFANFSGIPILVYIQTWKFIPLEFHHPEIFLPAE